MKLFVSKLMFPLSLALLVIGISVYVAARVKGRPVVKNRSASMLQLPQTHSAYTLVQQRILTFPEKEPIIHSIITRYRASDGNFVEVREVRGKQFLAFSHEGKYLRVMKDDSGSHLVQIGPYNANVTYTEEGLQRSKDLKKDQPIEWVAGVKCYVMQVEDNDNLMITYVAPSLGIPLQIVRKHKPTNATTIIKPVTLVFGEPDRKIFEELPLGLAVKSLPRKH